MKMEARTDLHRHKALIECDRVINPAVLMPAATASEAACVSVSPYRQKWVRSRRVALLWVSPTPSQDATYTGSVTIATLRRIPTEWFFVSKEVTPASLPQNGARRGTCASLSALPIRCIALYAARQSGAPVGCARRPFPYEGIALTSCATEP